MMPEDNYPALTRTVALYTKSSGLLHCTCSGLPICLHTGQILAWGIAQLIKDCAEDFGSFWLAQVGVAWELPLPSSAPCTLFCFLCIHEAAFSRPQALGVCCHPSTNHICVIKKLEKAKVKQLFTSFPQVISSLIPCLLWAQGIDSPSSEQCREQRLFGSVFSWRSEDTNVHPGINCVHTAQFSLTKVLWLAMFWLLVRNISCWSYRTGMSWVTRNQFSAQVFLLLFQSLSAFV